MSSFLALIVFLILEGLAISALERHHNNIKWRDWLTGNGGDIAPDGRDFHGRKIKR